MIRFTIRYLPGQHSAGCWSCGNAPVGLQTDRVTGSEWWTCKACVKHPGFCRRTQLHPDFKKLSKKGEDLHIKNCRNAISMANPELKTHQEALRI